MKPHQQRVVDEKTELDNKIIKLAEFINGNFYKTIPEDEQLRLVRQYRIMGEYSEILKERIDNF